MHEKGNFITIDVRYCGENATIKLYKGIFLTAQKDEKNTFNWASNIFYFFLPSMQ